MRDQDAREKQSSMGESLIEKELLGILGDTSPSRMERFSVIKGILDDIQQKVQRVTGLLTQEMEKMEAPFTPSHVPQNQPVRMILEEPVPFSLTERERSVQISNEQSIGNKIIEGVFDGQNMVGPSGKQYHVPVNYASKSKLVEGDVLKLSISDRGTFLFKQVGPIERVRIVGILEYNSEMREYYARAQDRVWKVLMASVTYFKGIPGDDIVLIVPKGKACTWAAVENIIKKDLI